MRGACLALVLLNFGLPATAQTLEIPRELRMAVDTASARGMAIFIHDASAARASDELMERKIFQRDSRLGGWLTDVESDRSGVIVAFIGTEGGSPKVLYRVRVPVGDGKLGYEAIQPAQPLSTSQQARWSARLLATAALEKREDLCSARYNTVVLSPDPAPDGLIHVYMLAATDKAGEVVAGGHFRYDFSPDGKLLEAQRAFTKSCFTIEPPDEKQGEPAGFFLTHLLDPTPTEIHVFLSRLHRQPVIVGAGAGVWSVDGGKIKLVEQRPN